LVARTLMIPSCLILMTFFSDNDSNRWETCTKKRLAKRRRAQMMMCRWMCGWARIRFMTDFRGLDWLGGRFFVWIGWETRRNGGRWKLCFLSKDTHVSLLENRVYGLRVESLKKRD
jgi:hypothetical protein